MPAQQIVLHIYWWCPIGTILLVLSYWYCPIAMVLLVLSYWYCFMDYVLLVLSKLRHLVNNLLTTVCLVFVVFACYTC
jgi:hypothetical protein